jgi:hypothetical protein
MSKKYINPKSSSDVSYKPKYSKEEISVERIDVPSWNNFMDYFGNNADMSVYDYTISIDLKYHDDDCDCVIDEDLDPNKNFFHKGKPHILYLLCKSRDHPYLFPLAELFAINIVQSDKLYIKNYIEDHQNNICLLVDS